VLKHSSVTHVDHVELDEGVVHICEEHFPQWAQGWKDPRVKLHIMDGSLFVANAASGHYDVIIQDSSDPHVRFEDGTSEILPSEVLFTDDHFRHCHRILNDRTGMFAMQSESFQLPDDIKGIFTWRRQILNAGFKSSRYGSIYVGSYPLGQIGFLLSKKMSNDSGISKGEQKIKADNSGIDIQAVQERFDVICRESNETTYYWPSLQESCFVLPRWFHKKLYEEENNR
jgi:spermidine synthase